MSVFYLDRLLDFLTSIELLMGLLWLGLAAFTIGLAILLYTRWGQYKPLRKCMAMSLLAHFLMAGYATTVEIVTPMFAPTEETVQLSLGDGPDPSASPGGAGVAAAEVQEKPWEVFSTAPAVPAKPAELQRKATNLQHEPKHEVRSDSLERVALVDVKSRDVKKGDAERPKPSSSSGTVVAIEPPVAQRRDPAQPPMTDVVLPGERRLEVPVRPIVRETSDDIPAALLDQIVSLPTKRESRGDATASRPAEGVVGRSDGSTETGLAATVAAVSNVANAVPDAYRLRVAPNRDDIVQSRGGTSETEAAVKAALRWLANNQSADGRWDPRANDAGNENNVLGRNRQNAGSHADSAMTGLALLAFLGAGHTHLDGPYQQDVRRGLEYLVRTQATDGSLGGQAEMFEYMYSHAMATCALSEAFGMTRDERLLEPVRRAVAFTVAAQDPTGGGWRYKPGDAGDTSQLGWQLMSLKSAELAGIPIPEKTRQGVIRYLQSVSSGQYGGRAAYRPREPATRSMTAEALVCWQFLGLAREHPACNEAGDFVTVEVPGGGDYNLYFWYYATLGLYQLQGPHWDRWNGALRPVLVSRQIKEGPEAGSWDVKDLWGGHGGRVFTTSLATLTLEVYYRFLPLYRGGFESVATR